MSVFQEHVNSMPSRINIPIRYIRKRNGRTRTHILRFGRELFADRAKRVHGQRRLTREGTPAAHSPDDSHARRAGEQAAQRERLLAEAAPPKYGVHDEVARDHLDARRVDEHARGDRTHYALHKLQVHYQRACQLR